MRCIAVVLCLTAVQGLLVAEKKEDEEPKQQAALTEDTRDSVAGPVGGPKYDKKEFKKDWRSEWKNGDFPSWKTTYPKAALKFEDRQSDGKIGNLMQVKPKEEAAPKVKALEEKTTKEDEEDHDDEDDEDEVEMEDKKEEVLKVSATGPLGGPKYDKKQFKKDWRSEWKNGDFPSWKETYPKAALKFEDRQSDGKIGNLMQVKPKEEAAPKVQALEDKKDEALKVSVAGPLGGPKYDKKQFKKDWRSEWKNGDFPSWKETYPKAALKFEDRQSDGKIGNFLLQAAPNDATEAEVMLKEENQDKALEALDEAAEKLADRAWKLGDEAAKDGASDETKKAAYQAQKDFEEADAKAEEEEENETYRFDEEEEEKKEDEKDDDDDDDDEDTDEKQDKIGNLLQVESKEEAAPKVQALEEKKKNEDEEQEGEDEQDEDAEDDRDEEEAEKEDADEDEEEKEHNKEETPKVATKANFLQKGTPQK